MGLVRRDDVVDQIVGWWFEGKPQHYLVCRVSVFGHTHQARCQIAGARGHEELVRPFATAPNKSTSPVELASIVLPLQTQVTWGMTYPDALFRYDSLQLQETPANKASLQCAKTGIPLLASSPPPPHRPMSLSTLNNMYHDFGR